MKQTALQSIELQTALEAEREKELTRRGLLSAQALRRQNQRYRGTGGISANNQASGFIPAFYDTVSGRNAISRFADGSPAPLHVLDGLPTEWIRHYDDEGHVSEVREGIIAGFLRAGRFYTREEAARFA